MRSMAEKQPSRTVSASKETQRQSLRDRISVLPPESREARTAYRFAETFAEELRLVYASRQQRATSLEVELQQGKKAKWSDRMIQVARTIVARKASRLEEAPKPDEAPQASAQAGAGA